LDIIRLIHHSMPDTRIVVVTMWAEGGLAADALRRGASAYIHQSATETELVAGIRAALSGQPYVTAHIATAAMDSSVETGEPILTPRQCEVVRLLVQGKSMKEVADVLRMSPRTVAFHKYSAMERFNIKTSAELVSFALTRGLV
jgi:DNA-binding NarL/FixJ family response regulator